MWQACSGHACFERLSGCPTSACSYALAKCSTYGTLDPRLARSCQVLKSGNLPESRLLAKSRLSGDSGDFWVRHWIWPESGLDANLARSGQTAGLAGSGQIGCPDQLSRISPIRPTLAKVGGSARKSEKLAQTPKSWSQGAIYRPLSIATSVENDWGRGGPFSGSALTLALETARF